MKKLLLALLLLLPLAAKAETALDLSAFNGLPVLQDGRFKPMGAFARALATQLADSDKVADQPALEWLARTIFDPASAAQQPVFAVPNLQVRAAMKLSGHMSRRFSLAELAPGLEATAAEAQELAKKDPKALSPDEQALFNLHTHVLVYNQLLQSVSLLLPLPMPTPDGRSGLTFLEVQKDEPDMVAQVKGLLALKGEDPDSYTDHEKRLAAFLFGLQKLRQGGNNNMLLRILPSAWQTQEKGWLSPWQLVLSGQSSPQSAAYLKAWQDMATAWRMGDATLWQSSSHQAKSLIEASIDSGLKNRLWLETIYLQIKPYPFAMLLYGLGALLAFWRPRTAMVVLGTGALLHVGGIALRIAILDRPPVGTLYESALFVSLVAVAVTLLVNLRKQTPALLVGGALAGLGLLFIAPVLQPEGDSLGTLTAVLNTNFWLGTHVLCITAGYGFCLLTAMLAHALLIVKNRTGLFGLMHRLSLAALMFTAIGTILGGIWADQSWGRFWGWDPKENGALLICLWLIWLQHGRLSGHLNQLAYIAGTAYLGVIVALAWFGVNLLSVGLHSYGFTSGIAAGLFTFCAVETLLIGGLWLRGRYRAA